MTFEERAKDFAIRFHGDQKHGCLTMIDHLTAVTDKLKSVLKLPQYGWTEHEFDVIIAAGWLHDVIEDTPVIYTDISSIFGSRIADIILAVTDGEGKNRYERHLNTYWRTRLNKNAILVKLCDRWHNHQRSIDNNEKFVDMYAKEYTYFKFALYEPGLCNSLWKELDQQYDIMLAMMNK